MTNTMGKPLTLNPDRLFSPVPEVRSIARRLYGEVAALPIISPHGHTDPSWFALNQPFANPAALFIEPDHYVYRMLYSQGISLELLGIPDRNGNRADVDPRDAWRLFAANFHLFRGTPSRLWLDWVFATVFGMTEQFGVDTADAYYDRIDAALAQDGFRPRALFDRYNIEVIATTESPLDPLDHHRTIAAANASGEWRGRVITAFRPDPVLDPDFDGFSRQSAGTGRDDGRGCGVVAGLSGRTAPAPRLFLRRWGRHRPTMVIRRQRPPTCRAPRPKRCSRASRQGRSAPPRPSCSARKC